MAELALSVTEFGPDGRGHRAVSGRPRASQARCSAVVRWRWLSRSGRSGVKTEATSLLHSFPTLSLSLAFSFSHARSNVAVAITVCLRRARSPCTQHRHLIHLFHICITTFSTTSNRHCSRSSLGKAPFRLATTAPSPERRRALGSPQPAYIEAPLVSLSLIWSLP